MPTISAPAVLIAATIFSVSLALLLHWAMLTVLFRWLPRPVRVHPPSFPTPDRLSPEPGRLRPARPFLLLGDTPGRRLPVSVRRG